MPPTFLCKRFDQISTLKSYAKMKLATFKKFGYILIVFKGIAAGNTDSVSSDNMDYIKPLQHHQHSHAIGFDVHVSSSYFGRCFLPAFPCFWGFFFTHLSSSLNRLDMKSINTNVHEKKRNEAFKKKN